jgi:hypothetical protein
VFDDLVEEITTKTNLVVDELGEERRCYEAERGGGGGAGAAGRGGRVCHCVGTLSRSSASATILSMHRRVRRIHTVL